MKNKDGWNHIPKTKWYYKEVNNQAWFAYRGTYLPTLYKRLPHEVKISVGPDWIDVRSLHSKLMYVFPLLQEYVDDLQKNYKKTGKYNVANTPHIF